ncbi:MAG: endonuclease [Acidimicrobiales bacterium]|nr:endonuclease [Acidimicrobiales bacterium]
MPLDVGRRERLATADQRRALITVAHGTCEWHGCDMPAPWCDAHHPEVWEATPGKAGGNTDIANLVLVCTRHHHLVHEGGFTVIRGPDGVEIRDPHGFPIPPPPKHPRPT